MEQLPWSHYLNHSYLEPIVCQILNLSAVQVVDWAIESLTGGADQKFGRGLGIHRVTGTARYNATDLSWSTVVKIFMPNEDNEPQMTEYWKREILAYQSGLLEDLPGSLVAPKNYAIKEHSGGEVLVWMEDIQETVSRWSMDEHYLTARHLGQFNGTYLAGQALPAQQEWMLPGRTKHWVMRSQADRDQLLAFLATDSGRQLLNEKTINRIIQFWEDRELILQALDRLPSCYCHHDAFRRNLMLREDKNGNAETVAIDWSYTGYGHIGQEIATTLAIDLYFFDVPATQAKNLNEAVFGGYLTGLADVDWSGDPKIARFGYCASAAITYGVAFALSTVNLLQRPGSHAILESIMGHTIEEILDQLSITIPFLLDLGDEALELMPSA